MDIAIAELTLRILSSAKSVEEGQVQDVDVLVVSAPVSKVGIWVIWASISLLMSGQNLMESSR